MIFCRDRLILGFLICLLLGTLICCKDSDTSSDESSSKKKFRPIKNLIQKIKGNSSSSSKKHGILESIVQKRASKKPFSFALFYAGIRKRILQLEPLDIIIIFMACGAINTALNIMHEIWAILKKMVSSLGHTFSLPEPVSVKILDTTDVNRNGPRNLDFRNNRMAPISKKRFLKMASFGGRRTALNEKSLDELDEKTQSSDLLNCSHVNFNKINTSQITIENQFKDFLHGASDDLGNELCSSRLKSLINTTDQNSDCSNRSLMKDMTFQDCEDGSSGHLNSLEGHDQHYRQLNDSFANIPAPTDCSNNVSSQDPISSSDKTNSSLNDPEV